MVKTLLNELDSMGTVPYENVVFKTSGEALSYDWNSAKLNIVHQNIRTMENLDDFLIFLDYIKTSVIFDLIIFSECRLHDNYIPKQIPGYAEYHSQHYVNQNGGVVVYVRDNIHANVQEIDMAQGNCLKVVIDEDMYIFAIYRSPSFNNVDSFLESLHRLLQQCSRAIQSIVIGDININTIGERHNQSDYLCVMAEHNFHCSIDVPTRVQGTSESCLDHVNTRNICDAFTFVIQNTITDHYTTGISIQQGILKRKNRNNYLSINYKTLSRELENETWGDILQESDTDNAMNTFVKKIENYINTNTSRRFVAHKKIHLTPWITDNVVKCIHKRNHLHKVVKRNPFDETKQKYYLRYRKVCKNIIRKAKELYYKNLLGSENSPGKMWEIMREITKTKPKKGNDLTSINLENSTTTKDPNEIACHANKYFTSIGSNLSNAILYDSKQSEDSLASTIAEKNISPLFQLDVVSNDEIIKIISSLKTTYSKGPDVLNTYILKQIKHHLAIPLSHIFNLSFSSGIFPKHLKQSIVHPIFKSGDRLEIGNYRPISLVSAFSKILEKAFKNRLSNYVESQRLISDNQFGFRPGIGTDDAIRQLTGSIVENINQGKKTIAIFLDLAKAFDTISHKILLKRLRNMGITGKSLSWLQSFISKRTQRVKIGECISTILETNFGVPQGSTLGPLLFVLYINELCNRHIGGKIITFADDTVLIFEGNSWDVTHKNAEIGMNIIKKWLDDNLLTLNIPKTKYIRFSPTITGQPKMMLSIKIHKLNCNTSTLCNCNILECVENIKYLGIFVDANLKWKKHIEYLANRVRKLIYIFVSLRNILSPVNIRSIYYGLCNSVMAYGCVSWGGAAKTILDPLAKAQKAVIRVILRKPYRFPSDELFKLFHVLDTRQIYIRSVLIDTCKKEETLTRVYHGHNTRSVLRNDLLVPRSQKAMFQNSFMFYGPKLLNLIPRPWRSESRTCFDRKVKEWLISMGRIESEKLLRVIT
jgi:hypothetical protein